MIYIFDKKQAIIKVLTNDDFTAAHLNFKINTATTFEFSLPASKALPSGSKYVATPHPLNDSKFIMLRLTERIDKTETIDYSAYELAYQELATDGYIEDKRPQNQSALNLMKIALDGSNWELNNVNVSGTATTNFYYVDRLSAISKVVDLLGGEIVFYIEIQGNAISGRYMDYLARQGADTSKVFASGSNLLTVERQSDTSGIYTAILPRGKGEEIDNGKADTPDGYGRRINIADVEWKKSAGKPLDKPKGSIVLSDPDATAEWGQINGNARLLLKTYDDIDDVNVLINSAYKTLQSVNHPQIQYSATVADVGGLSLGDTILIMHGDRDLSYKTRVFEVKYDLLSPDQTELSLGDDLSSNSITSQLNSLNAVADTTSSQTQWTINQIGRPGTTYGATAPDSPKVGDIWFKYLADGGTEIHRWNGNIWELLASPTTADDIAKAVDDAVSQAKSHIDEVKQGLSSDIATAKSQAASLASTAEANAKSEAVSQFNRAESILSEAKKDLIDGIEHEASERDKAVAAANSQAQNYVNQAKRDINDTINALSVGGRNLYLNSRALADGYGVNGNARVTVEPFDSTTNMWHIVAPQSPGTAIGIYIWDYAGGKIPNNSDWSYSANIKGTGKIVRFGIEESNRNPIKGTIGSKWTRISQTGHVGEPQAKTLNIYFETTNSPLDVYIKLPKLETGNIATDWSPAPEDVVLDYTTKDNKIKETITQYKETNDGHVGRLQTDVTTALGQITTKISQTDYDKKTGDLSTKINDVKDTADKAVRTIGEYQKSNDERVETAESSIERTANAITEKVSKTDYDKKTGELTHDLSELKHTAEGFEATVTKVKNLAVGGRNLLLGTATPRTVKANDSDWYFDSIYDHLKGGTTYTFSAEISVSNGQDSVSVAAFDPQGGTTWAFSPNFSKGVKRGSFTFTIPDHIDNDGYFLVYAGTKEHTAGLNATYTHMKLEEGNVPTAWTPAPEDVDSTIAKVKLTADEASTAVSKLTGVDGVITKAQADIKANADAITQKVSQTVYDQKTGDLTKAVAKAQTTADGVVTTVGNYQTSNDARVKEAETSIEQNSKDITLRATTSDLNSAKSDLSSSISKVKITADGINNFVRDSSGNISTDFQTALSKTSIITGSTLATSIQKQTATQISSALTDNNGKIISLINQDSSGVQIAGKNIVLNGDTTVTGAFKVSQANIANGAIGTAQIGDASITSANIANLDVSKITGNVSNFIQSNWNGVYGSTTITSSGMKIVSPGTVALFNINGMTLSGAGGMTRVANGMTQIYSATHENIGMIGHQKDVDHDNIDYITFGLNGYSTTNEGDSHWVGGSDFYGGDGMAFGVSNKEGTYDLKLRWDGDLIAGYKGEIQGWHASDAFIFDDKTYHKGYADFSGGVTMSGTYLEGTRSLHTHGMDISSGGKWFGFMDSSNSTGFGIDQTNDVWFFVKGQPYSLYKMLGRLNML
ncbi:phage tail spike protein [Leuconostoc mesenteroides]|uniref:phage tail spike protein n=1 Tax=Leuconostoc mesenteroides TaxID=1245 RepID=UPI00236314C9|nr:phage tail spike protein [Leuconostoc mesenteroides]